VQSPLQIVFHDLERSDAIEAAVRRHAEELEQFYDRITSCRVVIEAPHRHQHQGRVYGVRIDLGVPRKVIVVDRPRHLHQAHEDVYLAVADAFRAARRQLEDHVRRMRGDVKHREGSEHARVLRINPEEGYGFLETLQGQQVYFHRNSVLDDGFDRLEVGTEVRYTPGEGEEGPTAASVQAVGRHGHAL
jgi:cold shock CspA family protein/ribosome-associated translation inhibitor RaiA